MYGLSIQGICDSILDGDVGDIGDGDSDGDGDRTGIPASRGLVENQLHWLASAHQKTLHTFPAAPSQVRVKHPGK